MQFLGQFSVQINKEVLHLVYLDKAFSIYT